MILGEIKYDGMVIRLEMVDENRANELLSNNKGNRNKSNGLSERYARSMIGNRWRFVGDPIRLSRAGRLLDGQHRLEAISRTGKSIPMLLIFGLEESDQLVMDQGAVRRAGQQLQMLGYRQGQLLAAIAALVIARRSGTLLSGDKLMLGNDERIDFVEEHREGMEFARDRVTDARRYRIAIPGSVLGAVAFELYSKAEPTNIEIAMDSLNGAGPLDVWRIGWFFSVLGSGSGLTSGSPIMLLRNWAIRSAAADRRYSQLEHLYYLSRAWNAWRNGEALGKLQRPRNGEITQAHLVLR